MLYKVQILLATGRHEGKDIRTNDMIDIAKKIPLVKRPAWGGGTKFLKKGRLLLLLSEAFQS